jgi:ribosomal protein L11 methyltransferase
MPYRVDITAPPHDAFDRLVQLGALDIEPLGEDLAAILPDDVTPDAVARTLNVPDVTVSAAVERDSGSVWLLQLRPFRIGGIVIVPADVAASPDALRLADSSAFGTGHHPTTVLCIEAIEEVVTTAIPDSMLDVGTGSGVLALAALKLGVPRAVGVDIDVDALNIARDNARLNNLSDRLQLMRGGPDVVNGVWPLVVANVLAAPLIDMAPILIRRVGNRGLLILSGIPSSLESEVRRTYERLGMSHVRSEIRAGWTVVIFQTSW